MRVREKPKGCLPARFCGLARDKAAPDETGGAELLKFGETLLMWRSRAEQKPAGRCRD